MGFVVKRTIFDLIFTDPDLEGIRVSAGSIDTGTFLDMTSTMSGGVTQEDISAVRKLFTQFSTVLESWNLEEEDGTVIPATIEGMYSLEFPFTIRLIKAWLSTVGSIPDPLESRSTSGETSLEGSMPMETLSLVHTN